MTSTDMPLRKGPSGPPTTAVNRTWNIIAAGTSDPLHQVGGISETTVNALVTIPEEAKILITRRERLSENNDFGLEWVPGVDRTTTTFKIKSDASGDESTFDWAIVVPPGGSATEVQASVSRSVPLRRGKR